MACEAISIRIFQVDGFETITGFKGRCHFYIFTYQVSIHQVEIPVYRNRLIMVEQYEKITQLSSQPHQLSFGNDSLSITIRSQPFYRAKNKLFYSTEYPGIVELINGNLPFGTDGNMPNTAYQSIEIQTGSRKTIVPAGEFADLFEPNFKKTSVNYDRRQDILYIHAMNSDGAGGYLVIWRIMKGEYRDRFVAYGF